MLPPALLDRAKYLASPLRYAENRPDELARVRMRDYAWNTAAVAEREVSKWLPFVRLVQDGGTLGFSHEQAQINERRNLYHHNVTMAFAYAVGRTLATAREVTVLDWGGGLGHYAAIARALYPAAHIDYAIKETPAMVELGRQLNPEVKWYDDDVCLESRHNLVVVNASLQYMQEWQTLIPRLASIADPYLLFLRIPVVQQAPTYRAIQRAYGRELIHLQFNQKQLLDCVAQSGLAVERELLVGGRPFVRGAPEQPVMGGWLFSRRQPKSAE